MGYSPQGHKELDMTEWLTHTHTQLFYNVALVSSIQQKILPYVYMYPLSFGRV